MLQNIIVINHLLHLLSRLHVRSTSNNSSSTDADRKDNSESICLYILTEWCEAGTLRDWLNSHMEEHQARVRLKILQFFSQVCITLKVSTVYRITIIIQFILFKDY